MILRMLREPRLQCDRVCSPHQFLVPGDELSAQMLRQRCFQCVAGSKKTLCADGNRWFQDRSIDIVHFAGQGLEDAATQRPARLSVLQTTSTFTSVPACCGPLAASPAPWDRMDPSASLRDFPFTPAKYASLTRTCPGIGRGIREVLAALDGPEGVDVWVESGNLS